MTVRELQVCVNHRAACNASLDRRLENLTAGITDYIAESTEEVFATMEQIP
jgi:hypothetical protein